MRSTVRDIMTTRVIWVRKDASFREMAVALREHPGQRVPVLDEGGKVVGVVSEADLLTKEALDSEPEGMPGMITGILRRKEQEKARRGHRGRPDDQPSGDRAARGTPSSTPPG